jgi:hypothetical protein
MVAADHVRRDGERREVRVEARRRSPAQPDERAAIAHDIQAEARVVLS